ncbi:MAG: hypothetical protein CVU59_08820 [Deltaproteobacteria bacterium HGW-Deltaproteobacteria-17]|nr:MAG: hypothetical protein CVU59_08820 [Deltaproteobacteria bacterium HGW-Deltaproteobacteria-17]
MLYVGRKSRSRVTSLVFLAISLVFFAMYGVSGFSYERFLSLGGLNLLIALIYFERAAFDSVIQEKNAKIKKLKKALAARRE